MNRAIRETSIIVIRKGMRLLGFIFLLALMAAEKCPAHQPAELFPLDVETPWHIEADTLAYTKESKQYTAHGRVVVTKQATTIRAEHVFYNDNNGLLTAEGDVRMVGEGGDRITADRLEINLETETGKIYNGLIYQAKNNFYIKGDTIRKTGGNTYLADRVSVSTCNPDRPDWHISGRDLDITVEGYGSLRHATMWAKQVPVLYVPYLFFPVKTKRQTGFLIPELQHSDRKGVEYRQPFFWAIDESTDATFYLHHMGQRGQKLGFEYRRFFDKDSKLAVMYDYLDDHKVSKDVADDRFGFDHDSWSRTNTTRYWFRAKHDQVLPRGVSVLLDIDYVSDQDYLREFRDGYAGFRETEKHFEKIFDRDMDDYTDTTRTNRLNLNKSWTHYNLDASLFWYDNIIERRWDSLDDTAQRLPLIELNAMRHQLGKTPFFSDLDTEYMYCYRQDGTIGHRVDLHPRVYLPLQWNDIISIEPSLGLRETAWWIKTYQADNKDMDKNRSRELVDTKLDISAEIYRLFNWGDGQTKIKHTIFPHVVHEYVSRQGEEDDYPLFNDELDKIAEKNLLTYSLTQTLMVRQVVVPASSLQAKESRKTEPVYRYREVARLEIEQSYDIDEEREDDPACWTIPEEQRPFSPIRVELDIRPGAGMFLSAESEWCQYERRLLEYCLKTRLADNRGDSLYAEYRNKHRQLETIYARGKIVLNQAFSFYANHERNLYDNIDIETRLGILYKSKCWSLDVSYIDEPDDQRYMFVINLYGLGSIDS